MRAEPTSRPRRRFLWLGFAVVFVVGGWAGIRWVEQQYLPQIIERFHTETGLQVAVDGLGIGWHRGPQLRARGVTLHLSERAGPFELSAISWGWHLGDLLAGRFGGHLELEQDALDAPLPPEWIRLGLPETVQFTRTRATLTPVTEAGQTRFAGMLIGRLNQHPYTAEFRISTRESLERGRIDDFHLAVQFTDRPLQVELAGRVDDLFDWRGVDLVVRGKNMQPADWPPVRQAGFAPWLTGARMDVDARLLQPGRLSTARVEDLHIDIQSDTARLTASGGLTAPFSAPVVALDVSLDGHWNAPQALVRGLPGQPVEFAAQAGLSGGGGRWELDVMHSQVDWPQLSLGLTGKSTWQAGQWTTPFQLSVRHIDLPGISEAAGFELPAVQVQQASARWLPGVRRLEDISVALINPHDSFKATGAFAWPAAGPAMNLKFELNTRNPNWLKAPLRFLAGLDKASPLEQVSLSAEINHSPQQTVLHALRFVTDSPGLQVAAEGEARLDWPARALQTLALNLTGQVRPGEPLEISFPTALLGGLPPLDYRARLDWAAGERVDLTDVRLTGADANIAVEWNGEIGDLGGEPHWRGRLRGRFLEPGILRAALPEHLAGRDLAAIVPISFAADLDSTKHPLGLAAVKLESETRALRLSSDYLDLLLGSADWRGEYSGILPLNRRHAANNPVELKVNLPMRHWAVQQAEVVEARVNGPGGESVWRGQVRWTGGAEPHWEAELTADRFYWADWSDRPPDGRWFWDKPWKLDWLGASTGSVEIEFERFDNRWLSGQAMRLQADWGEGRLAVAGRLGLGAGVADLNWSMDTTQSPPSFALGITGEQLDSSYFLSANDEPWLKDGRVELEMTLRGRGESPAAMAAGAYGRVFIRALDSNVNFSELDNLGRDTLHQLVEVLLNLANPTEDESLALYCAALHLNFVDGVAESEDLLDLVTNNIVGRGRGRIELGDQTMDMLLSSRPRTGLRLQLNPLARLVRLSGPIAAPDISMDVSGLIEITAALASGGWTLLGRWLTDLAQFDEGHCSSEARRGVSGGG